MKSPTCVPFGKPLVVDVPEKCQVCGEGLRYIIPAWSHALYIYHGNIHLPAKNASEVIDTNGGIVPIWLEKWHNKEGD